MRNLSLFILITLVTACGPNYAFEETHTIDGAVWSYDDPLRFTFTIEDTQRLYDLHLRLTHRPDFFSQNLYVRFTTGFPGGEEVKETLSLQLADKFGRWFGDCDSKNCEINIPIQTGAYFDRPGEYTVSVEQWSRRENLEGMEAVGFALEELAGSK